MGAPCEASGFGFLANLALCEARYLIRPGSIDLLSLLHRKLWLYCLPYWINRVQVTTLFLSDKQTLVVSLSVTC